MKRITTPKIVSLPLLAMLAASLPLGLVALAGCDPHPKPPTLALRGDTAKPAERATSKTRPIASPETRTLVEAGIAQTKVTRHYDPAYRKLAYPGGDVPIEAGVCSDVIVRALRACGVDLQKEVHEDMAASFASYPRLWGLSSPDPNIDHRRVPNLMTFFKRRKKELEISRDASAYEPGDIVAWRLDNGLLHVGLVTNVVASAERFQMVHNIGAGARVEDVLFDWEIIGHYRYFN